MSRLSKIKKKSAQSIQFIKFVRCSNDFIMQKVYFSRLMRVYVGLIKPNPSRKTVPLNSRPQDLKIDSPISVVEAVRYLLLQVSGSCHDELYTAETGECVGQLAVLTGRNKKLLSSLQFRIYTIGSWTCQINISA
jgi:hypothetical protein